MACGCKGSTKGASSRQREAKTVEARVPREGGPGEPGYYWTGPKRKTAPRPA